MSNFKLENFTAVQKVMKNSQDTEIVGTFYMQQKPYLSYRSIDGSANNVFYPEYGKTNIPLLRKSGVAYGDGISTLVPRTPTPREISNAVIKSTGSKPNPDRLTDIVWLLGQFVDHTLDLTPASTGEFANMVTPNDDQYPGRTIPFQRSNFEYGSTPRQQINILPSFLDASSVYGSDSTREYALRELNGTGKLKTILSNNGQILPPYNTFNLPNAIPTGADPEDFFIAGDERSNENVALTAMHTLFIREHNRLCDEYAQLFTKEEEIYQCAKRKLTGFLQKIIYQDWLPLLIGPLTPYSGYKYDVDPSIATEFSTVGYRIGHTMISNVLSIGGSTITLVSAFFNPSYVQTNGVDNLLYGATQQIMQTIDNELVDDLRDFLFGPPTAMMMLDLASLNIQRGRDHGVPDYNTLRHAYGLGRYTSFNQISTNSSVVSKLQSVYNSIDGIDPWVGALCESHVSGTQVGPLIQAILKDQFERIRDGDRLWWEIDPMLTETDKNEISTTTLADIINRNCSLQVQDNVFKK